MTQFASTCSAKKCCYCLFLFLISRYLISRVHYRPGYHDVPYLLISIIELTFISTVIIRCNHFTVICWNVITIWQLLWKTVITIRQLLWKTVITIWQLLWRTSKSRNMCSSTRTYKICTSILNVILFLIWCV